MKWKQTLELKRSIKRRKEANDIPPDELHSELHRLGIIALQEGNLYVALNAYIELSDREGVRATGERCLQDEWYLDANNAFEFLNDRNGMLRVIQAVEGKQKDTLETALRSYLGSRTIDTTLIKFEEWLAKKGVKNVNPNNLAQAANMAFHLSGIYDMGIGIARQGMFPTYVFNLFGLPVKVAQCRRQGYGATFKWVDETSQEKLEGKKVVVIDDDVVSGRTTKRVLREIQQYRPKSVDLILSHNPIVPGPGRIGTIASSIPQGYAAVHYPKDFSYQRFNEAVTRLEQKLFEG